MHDLLHNKSPPCYNTELWNFANKRLSRKLRHIAAGKIEVTCNILRQVEGFPCQRFVNSPLSITLTYLPCHVAGDANFSPEGKYLLNSSFSSQCVSILRCFPCFLLLNFPVEGRAQTASHRRCRRPTCKFTAGITSAVATDARNSRIERPACLCMKAPCRHIILLNDTQVTHVTSHNFHENCRVCVSKT